MKVYRVDFGNGDPSMTFANKTAALKEARRSAREDNNRRLVNDETVTVYEETLVPITKSVIIDLINMSGRYVADDKVVATFTRKAVL